MIKNTGTADRIIRVLLGLVLLTLAFYGPQTRFGYIGFIPLLTGAFGYCPLYAITGINTCSLKKIKCIF